MCTVGAAAAALDGHSTRPGRVRTVWAVVRAERAGREPRRRQHRGASGRSGGGVRRVCREAEAAVQAEPSAVQLKRAGFWRTEVLGLRAQAAGESERSQAVPRRSVASRAVDRDSARERARSELGRMSGRSAPRLPSDSPVSVTYQGELFRLAPKTSSMSANLTARAAVGCSCWCPVRRADLSARTAPCSPTLSPPVPQRDPTRAAIVVLDSIRQLLAR